MSKDNPPLLTADHAKALLLWVGDADPKIGAALRALASGKTECRPAGECAWIEDEDGIWSAGCGMTGWHFPDGSSPQENTMKFCHHCGKPLAPALEYHRD
jgi:hypothetical protein